MKTVLSEIHKILSNKIVINFRNLIIGNAIYNSLIIMCNIIIARNLNPEGFGSYSFLLVQIQLFAAIASLGIRNIVIKLVARAKDRTKSILVASFTLQIFGFISASILLYLYCYYSSSINTYSVLTISIGIFFFNIWNIIESIYIAHEKMFQPSIIKSFTALMWGLFLIGIQIKNEKAILISYLVVLISNVLIILTHCLRDGFFKGYVSEVTHHIKQIFKESLPFYLIVLVSLPINYLTNNFLVLNSTFSEIGYFNISNRLIQLIKLVNTLALLSFFPNISVLWQEDRRKFIKQIEKYLPKYSFSLVFICFSISFFSKELIILVFGPEYTDSIIVFKYLLWFAFFFSLQGLFGNIWMASDNQNKLGKIGVLNAIFCTPIMWIGSYRGAYGLSLAYFVSYAISTSVMLIYFVRSLKLKLIISNRVFFITGLLLSIAFIVKNSVDVFYKVLIIVICFIFCIIIESKLPRKLYGKG